MKYHIDSHLYPTQVHIEKKNPMFKGMKDQVVKAAQMQGKIVLEAWYFKNELDLSGKTVAVMTGRRKDLTQAKNGKNVGQLPYCSVTMVLYHLCPGMVYVYPTSVVDTSTVEIPAGFDSVLINESVYVLTPQ